jgi:hypothetical protein
VIFFQKDSFRASEMTIVETTWGDVDGVIQQRKRFHASRFTLHACLLIVLLLVGCEGAEDDSETSAKPEGIVQGKIDDNGVARVAVVLAPKKPGGPAPDLSSFEGVDLFDRSQAPGIGVDTGVKGRADPGRRPNTPGTFAFSNVKRDLKTMRLLPHFPNQEALIGAANFGSEPLYGYASCRYVAFDHHADLSQGSQSVTFRRGAFEGKAEIYFGTANGQKAIMARINGGSPTFVLNVHSSANIVFFGMILPVESVAPRGLGQDELDEVLGPWRVEGAPQFGDRNLLISLEEQLLIPGSPRAGSTPFDFTLSGLIVKDVQAAYRPDTVDPASEQTFSAGAIFTGKASIVPFGGNTSNYRLVYKAEIFANGAPKQDVVRTIYGQTSSPGLGESTITVDWDGKGNNGQALPGDTIYGVSITAMLSNDAADTLLEDTTGFIFSTTPGVGPAGVAQASGLFEITPNPYIPYTAEEQVHGFDEEGYPSWVDLDGDGEIDFPDHNNDGEPDYQAGDPPPGITIRANLSRAGYNLSGWQLNVYAEDGALLHRAEDLDAQGRFGESGEYEWTAADIPSDLEPQELRVEIIPTYCRQTTADLQVLARTEQECGPSAPVDGTVALGVPVDVSLVRFGKTTSSGPYPVYDWRAGVARGTLASPLEAHYSNLKPLTTPVLFKKGASTVIKAQIVAISALGPLANMQTCKVQVGSSLDGGPPVTLGQLTLSREQFNRQNFHDGALSIPYTAPATVGRHRLRLHWKVEFFDSAGKLLTTRTIKTPRKDSDALMVYTVLEEKVPLDIQNDVGYSVAQEPWYNTDTFQQSDAAAGRLESASPLDQITVLAEGATDSRTAVSKLVKGFYLSSGAHYYSSTSCSDVYFGKNRLKLSRFLRQVIADGPRIECPQTASYLQVLLAFLGVNSSTLDLQPGGDADPQLPHLFTNNVDPLGSPDAPSYLRYDATEIFPPTRPGNPLDAQLSALALARGQSQYQQIRWDFHQILRVNESYYDASLRFDKNNPPDTQALTNPDFYLNQRNLKDGGMTDPNAIPILEVLEANSKRRKIPLPTGFGGRTSSDYVAHRASLGSAPQADHDLFEGGVSLSEYLDRLLYLETQPSLRAQHGYDPKMKTDSKSLIISLGPQ